MSFITETTVTFTAFSIFDTAWKIASGVMRNFNCLGISSVLYSAFPIKDSYEDLSLTNFFRTLPFWSDSYVKDYRWFSISTSIELCIYTAVLFVYIKNS